MDRQLISIVQPRYGNMNLGQTKTKTKDNKDRRTHEGIYQQYTQKRLIIKLTRTVVRCMSWVCMVLLFSA